MNLVITTSNVDRFSRHSALNDLIKTSFFDRKSSVYVGTCRQFSRWQFKESGWSYYGHPICASFIRGSASQHSFAANRAVLKKRNDYKSVWKSYHFVAFAVGWLLVDGQWKPKYLAWSWDLDFHFLINFWWNQKTFSVRIPIWSIKLLTKNEVVRAIVIELASAFYSRRKKMMDQGRHFDFYEQIYSSL